MSKRIKIILLSFVTVACCVALIVTSAFALFTDSISVQYHLQAGSLSAKLERISYQLTCVDKDGYLVENEEVEDDVELTNATTANVFGMTEDTLFVPGSQASAILKVSNTGNVAFGYYVAIERVNGGKETTVSDDEFARQMVVTVQPLTATEVGGSLTFTANGTASTNRFKEVGSTLQVGAEKSTLGVVDGSTAQYFKVTVEFLDDTLQDNINESDRYVNNDAMNSNVYFDLKVYAIQVTTENS
jgi:hypothetical protein